MTGSSAKPSLLFRIAFRVVSGCRRIIYRMLSNNRIEGEVVRIQALQCVGKGKIVCGGGVQVGYFPSPDFFSTCAYIEARHPEARISIGAGTIFNNNLTIIAERSHIAIGQQCLFGYNVEVIDSDFHALKQSDREQGVGHETASISIGDHVFVGSNVTILKGVTLGDGAVIANGAMVTQDVPPHAIVGGNPARLLKALKADE